MDPVFAYICLGLLAAVFLSGAVHKLRDPAAFSATLAAYRLLPRAAAATVGAVLMLAELLAGAGVALDARPALFGALGLLALYSAGIAVNLLRGRRDIDCGCDGSAIGQTLSWGLVVRNLLLMALGIAALLPRTPRALGTLDIATVVLAVIVLALSYVAANRLLASLPRSRALA